MLNSQQLRFCQTEFLSPEHEEEIGAFFKNVKEEILKGMGRQPNVIIAASPRMYRAMCFGFVEKKKRRSGKRRRNKFGW